MLGYSYDADELLQVITKLEVDKDILTTRKTLRRVREKHIGNYIAPNYAYIYYKRPYYICRTQFYRCFTR